jgi:hypothetical protein
MIEESMGVRISKNGKPIGRPPGAINKKTQEMKRLLEEQGGMGPLEFLWHCINNKRLPTDLRITAARDLAPFLHPKLTAIAAKVDVEHRQTLRRQTEIVLMNPELADAAERLALALAVPPDPVIDIRHQIPGPPSAEELER